MSVSSIIETWDLDAWSISKDLFKKITDILPAGSTILEFGSGKGTDKLSKIYNMKSIEDDARWLNAYKSQYFQVPLVDVKNKYAEFKEDPHWYDEKILKEIVPTIGHYDCILVDGPKGYRGGLYYNHLLFDFKNTVVIFDDVHAKEHFKLMNLISTDVGRTYTIYSDSAGKQFGILC